MLSPWKLGSGCLVERWKVRFPMMCVGGREREKAGGCLQLGICEKLPRLASEVDGRQPRQLYSKMLLLGEI